MNETKTITVTPSTTTKYIASSATNTITRMTLPGMDTLYLDLAPDIKERLYSEFLDKLSEIPILSHKCNSCGGTVEMDADRHIFICPYCGTCYAVGTRMTNDKGVIR